MVTAKNDDGGDDDDDEDDDDDDFVCLFVNVLSWWSNARDASE